MSVSGKNWRPYSSQEDKVAESGLIGAACSCLITLWDKNSGLSFRELWQDWAPVDHWTEGHWLYARGHPPFGLLGLCRSHPEPQLHPLRLWPKSDTYPTAFIELKVGNKPSVPASVKGEWHPWGRSRLGGGTVGTRSKGGHHTQELSDTKYVPNRPDSTPLSARKKYEG